MPEAVNWFYGMTMGLMFMVALAMILLSGVVKH